MAARAANVKGIKVMEEPLGADKGGVALLTIDLIGVVFTGGADTITVGGGGQDAGVTSSDTLAVMISKRRRDGKTITLTGVSAASVFPGAQGAVTAYAQSFAVSGANLNAGVLKTLAAAGADVSTTAAAWDRALGLAVTYTAT